MKCFRPTYINEFKCNGKICESRCCKGWRVVVDNNTYMKYSKINDEKDRLDILSLLEKLDDKNYSVKMKDDLTCPFLDNDFLCKIQKNHGEDYLTAICHSYPRVNYRLGEVIEQSLTLTCPIAARLILLSNTSIQFEEVEINEPHGLFDWSNKLKMPYEDAITLQANAIANLQKRQMPINERLIWLCLLLQDEKFVGKIDLAFDINRHADIMIEIFSKMYDDNMSIEKKEKLKQIYVNYNEVILSRLMENYSHIFENYLVNEFFMRCYPFAFEGGLWKNCKIFITAYKVMEFAITLTVIAKNGFVTTEEFLNMINAVNEKLDHNRIGMKAIIDFSENAGDLQNFSKMIFDK